MNENKVKIKFFDFVKLVNIVNLAGSKGNSAYLDLSDAFVKIKGNLSISQIIYKHSDQDKDSLKHKNDVENNVEDGAKSLKTKSTIKYKPLRSSGRRPFVTDQHYRARESLGLFCRADIKRFPIKNIPKINENTLALLSKIGRAHV